MSSSRRMPNHWETSARPLFVKTVFVNGNRHAILSREDPLLRPGLSHSKKPSRPNSSPSLGTDFSVAGSDGPDSSAEDRKPERKGRPLRRRDVSSELQSCCRLIKLGLASSVREEGSKDDDRVPGGGPEKEAGRRTDRGSLGQSRRIWTRIKSCRKNSPEDANENSLMEYAGGRDKRYYVYNFESNGGKKDYCFVKISSKPSQFIVNCSCDDDFCDSKDSTPSNKNNLVISATFHNLILAGEKNQKLLKNSANYVFSFGECDPCEMWNHYLARSHYNSLTERVLQWMEMTNGQKTNEGRSQSFNGAFPLDGTERIYAGDTFLQESDKTKRVERISNKPSRTKEKGRDSSSSGAEAEVKGEANVETVLSKEEQRNASRESPAEETASSKSSPISAARRDSPRGWERRPRTSTSISSPTETTSAGNRPRDSTPNSTDSFPAGNLFLGDFGRGLGWRSKRRLHRERRGQKKQKETSEEEDGDEKFKTTVTQWRERRTDRSESGGKYEESHTTMTDRRERIWEACASGRNNQLMTQELTERSQRSVIHQSILRSRAALAQNLLSPHRVDTSWLRGGKTVRPSEKDLGRPQLHIFMPAIPAKDPSEDSVSDPESFSSEMD